MISSKKALRLCCSIALALRKGQTLWPLCAMFLFSASTMAQQAPHAKPQLHPQSSPSTSGPAQNSAPDETPIIIPGGTRLALVLTHPVDSKFTGRGDRIYAETTAPLILENRAVVPAGSFVQGKVEKLTRRGESSPRRLWNPDRPSLQRRTGRRIRFQCGLKQCPGLRTGPVDEQRPPEIAIRHLHVRDRWQSADRHAKSDGCRTRGRCLPPKAHS